MCIVATSMNKRESQTNLCCYAFVFYVPPFVLPPPFPSPPPFLSSLPLPLPPSPPPSPPLPPSPPPSLSPLPPSPPSLQHKSILVLIYVDTVMNQIEGIVRRRETKPGYNTSHNSRNNESKQDFYITSIIVIHFTLFM